LIRVKQIHIQRPMRIFTYSDCPSGPDTKARTIHRLRHAAATPAGEVPEKPFVRGGFFGGRLARERIDSLMSNREG
jgi:hypothetical protein